MLAANAAASPPLALMPFTTSSQAGSLRLDTTTLAPCDAICSQIERPMPRLPPVTTATLSERSNIFELIISASLSPSQGQSNFRESTSLLVSVSPSLIASHRLSPNNTPKLGTRSGTSDEY